jgi:CRISPR type IV-associated protein Csf3
MRERYGPQDFTEAGQDHSERVAAVSLPIVRCEEHGPMWYYACSFAQWPKAVANGRDYWNKRPVNIKRSDLIDFAGRRGKVVDGSGRYKAYHMPVWTRHAQTICWYMVAHRRSIEHLLQHVTHLGKKTSHGHGSVLSWTIESWHADWSVRGEGGRLMRAIPAAEGLLVGFRPSYWLPKNQTVCEMPTAAPLNEAS